MEECIPMEFFDDLFDDFFYILTIVNFRMGVPTIVFYNISKSYYLKIFQDFMNVIILK